MKRHPKYKWLWLDESGNIWSALVRTKNSNDRVDCGEPVRQLHPTINFHGYRVISIRWKGAKKQVKIQRLMADIFMPGTKMVGHKDCNKSNDKLSNLEPTTISRNSLKSKVRAKSGAIGVYWDNKKQRWYSYLTIHGKIHYIGITYEKKGIPALAAKRKAILDHYLETGKFDKTVG